jgi:hypothetical protein
MDREQLADDLHVIRRVLDQTQRRVDPQMFHMILWGVIVLVWYPLMNWFDLRGNGKGMAISGIAALGFGVLASTYLGWRASRKPRIAAGNAHLASQIGKLVAIFIVTGVVLSMAVPALVRGGERYMVHLWGMIYALMLMSVGVVYSRLVFWCGVPSLLAVLVMLRFPEHAGFVVGPAMGIGSLVAGLIAERRVARLRRELPAAGDALDVEAAASDAT